LPEGNSESTKKARSKGKYDRAIGRENEQRSDDGKLARKASEKQEIERD
jgi:hypothetical protein